MSPDTRLMVGLSLILIPTIVYGGLTVLGVVTNRLMGSPGPMNLSPMQIAYYRADTPMPEFSLCLQCSYKSQSTMLRSQVFLSGQSEWEQSLRQFWFPADFLPWRTGGRCALFFTPARFWSRRQLLRWELG